MAVTAMVCVVCGKPFGIVNVEAYEKDHENGVAYFCPTCRALPDEIVERLLEGTEWVFVESMVEAIKEEVQCLI